MNNYESLSEREKEVLELISKGKKTKEVAKLLNISLTTVKTHITSIYEKLCVSTSDIGTSATRVKAITIYWKNNIEELKDFNLESLM